MSTTEQAAATPVSDEEQSSARLQDLIDSETLRWREMRGFSREHTGNLLDRLKAYIDAWLGRV
ncbi:MAG TPA: hypothetical protein VMD92_15950 [Acidobacteriaceae bacterium]|jgi:hypothetical protein|nr:hypothetical protein [Acidobacteriaceae bacterium]